MSNVGQLLGCVLIGVSASALGRRLTLVLQCAPLLVGWLVIATSQADVAVICIGRLVQGIGVMSSVTQVYLVEIANANNRYTC